MLTASTVMAEDLANALLTSVVVHIHQQVAYTGHQVVQVSPDQGQCNQVDEPARDEAQAFA